jgi:hypothetical protein
MSRDLRPWLVAAGLWFVLALHALPDTRPPSGVWGGSPILAFSPVVRWLAVGLAAFLALPPVSGFLARVARPRAQALAREVRGVPPVVWIALLVALAWLIRSHVLYGDGAATIENLRWGELINYKEPLDRLITALVYRAGRALTGWDAGTAIALVSTVAGGLYWGAVLRFARSKPLGPGSAWIPWLLLATPGTTQLFCGYVENYSLLSAGTAWTLVLALEAATNREKRLWQPALAFGLTLATHLSAIWLGAAMPVLWLVRLRAADGGSTRGWIGLRSAIREAACGALVAAVPLTVVSVGMAASGMTLARFSATEFGGGDGKLFVPLHAVRTPFERFTMFSSAHFAAFGNELLLVVPAGLVLALLGWLGHRRSDGRTDAGTWPLLAAAVGTVLYAFVFNPDMMVANPALGVMNEWDLFSFEAIPISFLGVWWLRTAFDAGDQRDGVALAIGATALLHVVGWLCLNAHIVI